MCPLLYSELSILNDALVTTHDRLKYVIEIVFRRTRKCDKVVYVKTK